MLQDWISAMRPRTLPVSVAGVVTAIGFAIWNNVFNITAALLCFVFALLAQIVSNFANEYYDFLRGSDKKGRVGPKRGVTEGDISPRAMRNVTFGTLIIACCIGCGLIPFGGLWLIPVGIIIAIFALAYSTGPYPLSYHGLGDVAVLIFFGIVPVNLCYFVQSGGWNLMVFLASISIGLLSINVLLVNNYRDMEDDLAANKHTTVVIFGRKVASIVYLLNGFIAMALLLPVWIELRFFALFVPMLYIVLHLLTWYKLKHYQGEKLNIILGKTAKNMLIFAVILFILLTKEKIALLVATFIHT